MTDIVERLRAFPAMYQNGAMWVMSTKPEPLTVEAAAEIEKLRAERDALKEDAARYRWLRNADNWSEHGPCPLVATCEDTIYGEALDHAIDAALASGEKDE